MLTFSIAAPQSVALPDGTTVHFRVNPADTSLCEIHIAGSDARDTAGTHVLTFKRNGQSHDTSFVPTPRPPVQPAYKDSPYPSVNDDAVRATDPNWDRNPATKSAGSSNAKPLGGEKVDPVHGKITTAGTDAQAGKPREAKPEDASSADRAERASVGIPPSATPPDRGYVTAPVDNKPAA